MVEPLAQPESSERQKCPECSACGGHHPRCSLIGGDEARRQLHFYYDLWVTKETDVRQRLAAAALHHKQLRDQVTFWQGKYRIVVQENNAFRRKLQKEKADSGRVGAIEKFIADKLDVEADERERLAVKHGAAFSDIANWQRKIASRIRSRELSRLEAERPAPKPGSKRKG